MQKEVLLKDSDSVTSITAFAHPIRELRKQLYIQESHQNQFTVAKGRTKAMFSLR